MSSADSPHTSHSSSSSSPSHSHAPSDNKMIDNTHQPMRNYDGTEMRDANCNIVYKSQFLSTHPLKSDIKERVGYAGRKLCYVSGDGVIRTMNAIFGHGGWSSQITMERNILNEKDERGRWNVGYLSTVKVTLLNGVSHEDCGSGEGIDNNKLKAHEKAMKSAVTDAMKRAARHFGERLGNALYVKGSGMRTAPRTNKDALLELERNDALNLFGDQATLRLESPEKKPGTSSGNTTVSTNNIVPHAAAANNNNGSAGQKENWQQSNQVGQTSAIANAYNTRPCPNNFLSLQQQQQQSVPTVMPSPIASTTVHRGGTSQSNVTINNGIRNGNPSPVYNMNMNNNIHQHHTMLNAPQPPNLMAPPPRPMYNPGIGGNVQNGLVGGGNGGKRGLDGIGNQYNMNSNSTSIGSNNSGISHSGSGSVDNTKRQKVNPYNSNNSSKNNRLSV